MTRGQGAALAGLLLGAVAAAWPGASEDKGDRLPADLRLVPADVAGFVSVRVSAVLKEKGLGALRKEVAGALARMEKETRVPLAGAERLTVVLTGTGEPVLI